MVTSFRRPRTAQEAVLDALRRHITTGRLRPGAQIVQDALAEELQVSRVPLREALRTLEGEGQVTYVPHRGYFVTELSLADLLEVYRIREILEAEAVRVAVPLLGAEDLDRLRSFEAEVVEAAAACDVIGMTRANRSFHFTLIGGCGLPRLVRLIGQLWDATEVYRSVYYDDPVNRGQVLAEHRAVVQAAEAGDVRKTLRALDTHRTHTVDALRPMLEPAASD